MITKFKIFENIEIKDKSYWVIYGDYNIVINIIEHLLAYFHSNNSLYEDLKLVIKSLKGYRYKDINGIFLYYSNDHKFSFGVFLSRYNDKNKLKEYNLKGEIKLKNNKIVLDTLKVDMEKYNL